MKSWSASSALPLLAALWSWPVFGASVAEGVACLEATHLSCARQNVDVLRADGTTGDELDELEAWVLFHEGRWDAAVQKLSAVAQARPEDFEEGTEGARDQALFAQTLEASSGLVETTRGRVTVLHHPGIDRLLVEEALTAVEDAERRIAPLLGGVPPEPVRIEIYPDGQSFTLASSLPLEAIQTTGVVAISKWNRLLLVSPRVLGRGYGWKDTLVHEWIHGVVAWHSDDKCPVWLQEGIAKGLDMLWRQDDFELSLQMQSLLAVALQRDEWVTLAQMHPSFALLPSAEMAGLAYAQVATQVELVRQTKGEDAIAEVLQLLREGEDAGVALARVYGAASYEELEADWKVFVGGMDLVQERLAALPTVLDGQGDEFATDPHLSQRQDLADKARLGDLMAERNHPEAALLYYKQAMPEEEHPGPDLALRMAEVQLELGGVQRARATLEENLRYYPEYAPTLRLLGTLLVEAGEVEAGLARLLASTDTDPFDLETQQELARLYAEAGLEEEAARRKRYIDILYYR